MNRQSYQFMSEQFAVRYVPWIKHPEHRNKIDQRLANFYNQLLEFCEFNDEKKLEFAQKLTETTYTNVTKSWKRSLKVFFEMKHSEPIQATISGQIVRENKEEIRLKFVENEALEHDKEYQLELPGDANVDSNVNFTIRLNCKETEETITVNETDISGTIGVTHFADCGAKIGIQWLTRQESLQERLQDEAFVIEYLNHLVDIFFNVDTIYWSVFRESVLVILEMHVTNPRIRYELMHFLNIIPAFVSWNRSKESTDDFMKIYLAIYQQPYPTLKSLTEEQQRNYLKAPRMRIRNCYPFFHVLDSAKQLSLLRSLWKHIPKLLKTDGPYVLGLMQLIYCFSLDSLSDQKLVQYVALLCGIIQNLASKKAPREFMGGFIGNRNGEPRQSDVDELVKLLITSITKCYDRIVGEKITPNESLFEKNIPEGWALVSTLYENLTSTPECILFLKAIIKTMVDRNVVTPKQMIQIRLRYKRFVDFKKQQQHLKPGGRSQFDKPSINVRTPERP